MHLERPCWWNTKIPRLYKILMRHFLSGMRKLNISPQSASVTKTRPLQPSDLHNQDSSPRLELGFAGQNKFLVWEIPLQQQPSSFPAVSQQVCWMHICLPRTCWAAKKKKEKRKASPSWDWRICPVLQDWTGAGITNPEQDLCCPTWDLWHPGFCSAVQGWVSFHFHAGARQSNSFPKYIQ